jgi:hypothetical protein
MATAYRLRSHFDLEDCIRYAGSIYSTNESCEWVLQECCTLVMFYKRYPN